MSVPKDQVYTLVSLLQVASSTVAKVIPTLAGDSRCDTVVSNSVTDALKKRVKK